MEIWGGGWNDVGHQAHNNRYKQVAVQGCDAPQCISGGYINIQTCISMYYVSTGASKCIQHSAYMYNILYLDARARGVSYILRIEHSR